jgi:hypothetical protein
MKRGLTILALLALLPSLCMAQRTCHTQNGESQHFRRVFFAMMAADQGTFRTKYSLPLVDSTQITLVSDSTVCARAGQALDSLARVWEPTAPGPASTAPLYVFKIGTMSYALVDAEYIDDDDFEAILFFGSDWSYKGSSVSQ